MVGVEEEVVIMGEVPVSSSECKGQADCFRGTFTEIVDGARISQYP